MRKVGRELRETHDHASSPPSIRSSNAASSSLKACQHSRAFDASVAVSEKAKADTAGWRGGRETNRDKQESGDGCRNATPVPPWLGATVRPLFQISSLKLSTCAGRTSDFEAAQPARAYLADDVGI